MVATRFGTIRRRFTSRFLACALTLFAGIATLSPVGAHEGHDDAHGLFDTFSSLLRGSDNNAVNVPKRRKSAKPSHTATHTHDTVAEGQISVQQVPEVAPVVVPKRKRQDPVQALPVLAPVAAPDTRGTSELRTVLAPIDASHRSEGAQSFHVFRATQDVISEIAILRDGLGIRDFPPEAEFVEGRGPVHVYAKSLEVLDKVLETQQRLFVPVGIAGRIPLKEISNGDVLANIEHILAELRKIKSRVGIARHIEPALLDIGRSHSMVYKSLADASFMLDGLRGRTVSPNDVFQNAVFLFDELTLIAKRFNTPLSFEFAPVEGAMKTIDVAIQTVRARYKLVELQTMLQMDSSSVPTLTLDRVTPSENYDAINLLLAEMTRIKVHIGVNQPRVARPERSTGNGPNDTFALIELINQNLDRLATAVTG